jgi:hypothetical protein
VRRPGTARLGRARHTNSNYMASITCKCGNRLSNSSVPNEVQYYIYSDREWIKIIELGVVETINLPQPKHDVWKCDDCNRLYVFNQKGEVIKIYSLENGGLADSK